MPAASLSVLVTDDVVGVDRVVDRVGAARRGHDRVGDVAVVEDVVDAGHRHGLRRVPVRGRKGDARRDRPLRGIARAQADRHVRRSVCDVSTTVKVAVPSASSSSGPAIGESRVMPAASLSVLVTATSAGVDRVVDRVGAGRRGHDRVGDVAVVQDVVDAGHRHRSAPVCPVHGREREAGRDRPLRGVARAQRRSSHPRSAATSAPP